MVSPLLNGNFDIFSGLFLDQGLVDDFLFDVEEDIILGGIRVTVTAVFEADSSGNVSEIISESDGVGFTTVKNSSQNKLSLPAPDRNDILFEPGEITYSFRFDIPNDASILGTTRPVSNRALGTINSSVIDNRANPVTLSIRTDGPDDIPTLVTDFLLAVSQASEIQGSIFEDINGNGLLDAGEPGLGGVRPQLTPLDLPAGSLADLSLGFPTRNAAGEFSIPIPFTGNYSLSALGAGDSSQVSIPLGTALVADQNIPVPSGNIERDALQISVSFEDTLGEFLLDPNAQINFDENGNLINTELNLVPTEVELITPDTLFTKNITVTNTSDEILTDVYVSTDGITDSRLSQFLEVEPNASEINPRDIVISDPNASFFNLDADFNTLEVIIPDLDPGESVNISYEIGITVNDFDQSEFAEFKTQLVLGDDDDSDDYDGVTFEGPISLNSIFQERGGTTTELGYSVIPAFQDTTFATAEAMGRRLAIAEQQSDAVQFAYGLLEATANNGAAAQMLLLEFAFDPDPRTGGRPAFWANQTDVIPADQIGVVRLNVENLKSLGLPDSLVNEIKDLTVEESVILEQVAALLEDGIFLNNTFSATSNITGNLVDENSGVVGSAIELPVIGLILGDVTSQVGTPDGDVLESDSLISTVDVLVGLTGQDYLVGGIGENRFVYTSDLDGFDRIANFETGLDKIDVEGLLQSVDFTGGASAAFDQGLLRLQSFGSAGSLLFGTLGQPLAFIEGLVSQSDIV